MQYQPTLAVPGHMPIYLRSSLTAQKLLKCKMLIVWGHVQKHMGTASCNLKQEYRNKAVRWQKKNQGAGRLTDSPINSLQNSN